MASQIINDFVSLAEEKFDFDLPPSPASDKGDKEELDDEVFTGSFGQKERCISVEIDSALKEGSSASSVGVMSMELGSWSPLTGEKFDQIIQEAHMVAREIGKNCNGGSKPADRREDTNAARGKDANPYFAEDSSAKLSALSRPPAPSLTPIKRETFCVQDSPLKQLPPAIQQRLLKAGGVSNRSAAQVSARNASPRRATPCPAQPKAAPRGKAALSNSRAVLPSRPTVPGVTQPSAKMRLPPPDRTRLAPPDKRRAVQKRSPSGRPVSRAGSSEDLLSDTASMASDISDSSFNTSLPGKRGLSVPSKAGLRAPPAMKAPTLPGRLIIDKRRNTTSSSSSASSLNSSLTATPSGKGTFNTSLSSGAVGAKPRGPGSLSQLPNSGATSTKPRALSATSRTLEPMRAGAWTPATQGKKPTEPQAMPGKSTPIKKPDPAPSNQTPAKRPPQRACSDPSHPTAVAVVKPSVSLKGGNPKLRAFIAPTPMGQMKRPRRPEAPSPDPTRTVKPKTLVSAFSTESLQAEAAVPAVLQTPTAVVKAIPALARRSSALPTPVNRRVSGIPCITPKSIKRGQTGERLDLLGSGSKISHGSPIQKNLFQRPRASGPKFVPTEEPSCLATPRLCVPVFSLEDDSEETVITDPVPSTPPKTSQHSGHSLQHQNTPESSTENRNAPESTTENMDAPESSTENRNTPDSSTEILDAPESSTENVDAPESSTENVDAPESSTENVDAPKSSTENPDAPKSGTGQPVHSGPEELQKPPKYTMKTPENKEVTSFPTVLLVDAPAPVLRIEERLLIDLSNTCDLIKAVPLKPTGALLIDLSSPLITWSPIDKKENAMDTSPLINLSF